MEITLHPNGDKIKIWWQDNEAFDSGHFGPILVDMHEVNLRSATVRELLTELSRYFEKRLFSVSNSTDWDEYSSLMVDLTDAGVGLYTALLENGGTEQTNLRKHIESLNPGSEIELHCHDDKISIPFGFIAKSPEEFSPPQGKPHRAHFDHFWVNKYRVHARILNCRVQRSQLEVEPETFKALYALHKDSVVDAVEYLKEMSLVDEVEKFNLLKTIDVKTHHEWHEVKNACKAISDAGSIIFVLAHSNGDTITLGQRTFDSGQIAQMIQHNRDEAKPELLILNCCASATGGEGKSLLSAVAKTGFCGLIGTEAKISNVHALRCGIHLMWNLCDKGVTLGDAFRDMQASDELFPINLLYTCYASREFRLKRPIQWKRGG